MSWFKIAYGVKGLKKFVIETVQGSHLPLFGAKIQSHYQWQTVYIFPIPDIKISLMKSI